jgi:hypothetical protein
MLMTKEGRPAIRTLRGWTISVLHEAHAIREWEEHGWRFKSRDDDRAARVRHVSAAAASSDEASAVVKNRRSKGSK